MKIGVVILDLNQRDMTLRCLESLDRGSVLPNIVVVVENGSEKVVVPSEDRRFAFQTMFLPVGANLGCAGGRNLGLDFLESNTDAQVYVVLDNDTVAPREFIANVGAGVVPEVGVVAPVIRDFGTHGIWSAGGIISPAGIVSQLTSAIETDQAREVDWAPGACLIFSRNTWQLGIRFDDWLNFYFEDIDWCCKVRGSGGSVQIWPSVEIYHEANQSLGGEWSPARVRLWSRNGLVFLARMCGWTDRAVGRWLVDQSHSLGNDILNMRWPWVSARVRGVVEGLIKIWRTGKSIRYECQQ
ncbi:hypothetical protein [Pseudofrankia sp. DC12]|uniref:glycosyltransferase family 2 protein n=1 Tax=Pseudofrankia sp. DC12 TaxID=683315 RepID=UPI000A5E5DC6|nr:hypothetical protein [Pseudofrankia sp. DC12]